MLPFGAEHLRSHPLRGPIFETWVVSEIAKQRFHRGEAGGLSCFRDRSGAEADLVVDAGRDGVTIVEAKSAETPSPILFAGARRARRRLDLEERNAPVLVVHGGDAPQRRGADRLVPWSGLHRIDW